MPAGTPKTIWRIAILLAASLFAGVLVWQLLPHAARPLLEKAAIEKGADRARLPLSSIGFTGAVVGDGWVSGRGQTLTWGRLEVGYSPVSLLSGDLGSLYVEDPHLRLQWPLQRPLARPEPIGVESEGEEPPGRKSPSPPPERKASPEPRKRLPQAEERKPKAPVIGPRPLFPTDRLFDVVQSLPTGEMMTRNGALSLAGPDGTDMFRDQPFNISYQQQDARGSLRLESLDSTLDLSWRLDGPDSFTSDLHLEMGENMLHSLDGAFGALSKGSFGLDEGPVALSADLLLETRQNEPPRVAFTVDWERIRLVLSDELRLGIDDALLAGRLTGEGLEAGLTGKLAGSLRKGPGLQPFAFKAALHPNGKLALESDAFELTWEGWKGSFAFRGELQNCFMPAHARGYIELASSGIEGNRLSVGPASFLLRRSGAYSLAASPLELSLDSPIWIEELEANTNLSLTVGDASFAWFNQTGAHMGKALVKYRKLTGSGDIFDWALEQPDGSVFLEGNVTGNGDRMAARLNGEVELSWINALLGWCGVNGFSINGPNPGVSLSVEGPGTFLRGSGTCELADLEMSFPGGAALHGLRGKVQLEILGLPRSSGVQHLKAHRFVFGGVTLEDPEIEWSLPTIRTLRVHQAKAEIEGGQLYLSPFVFDPFEPSFQTRLNISRFKAGMVLQWLGEDRFHLEGLLRGSVALNWRDGVLRVGESQLLLEPGSREARFLFLDEGLLREQFSALGGVPPDLKTPLLEALLNEGISIKSLKLSLIPGSHEEELAIRLEVSGETATDEIVVPVEGLVVNNLISREDLTHLLGFFLPVEFPSSDE